MAEARFHVALGCLGERRARGGQHGIYRWGRGPGARIFACLGALQPRRVVRRRDAGPLPRIFAHHPVGHAVGLLLVYVPRRANGQLWLDLCIRLFDYGYPAEIVSETSPWG